jgi:uncharacterized protein YdeI (YjbR/CyaY-like superfamily)
MGRKDPRVDAYIQKAADWQQPVLNHIREIVHDACPDAEETMKWSSPSFTYKGLLCGMQAFKARCMFGFWKAPLVLDDVAKGNRTYRYFGDLTKVSDLPSRKVLTDYIRKAMALNENGVAIARKPRAKAKLLRMPGDLAAALQKNKKAQKAFEEFSPSHKNEYVEWITAAKADETRQRRLETAIGWIAQGKSRNWKYQPS